MSVIQQRTPGDPVTEEFLDTILLPFTKMDKDRLYPYDHDQKEITLAFDVEIADRFDAATADAVVNNIMKLRHLHSDDRARRSWYDPFLNELKTDIETALNVGRAPELPRIPTALSDFHLGRPRTSNLPAGVKVTVPCQMIGVGRDLFSSRRYPERNQRVHNACKTVLMNYINRINNEIDRDAPSRASVYASAASAESLCVVYNDITQQRMLEPALTKDLNRADRLYTRYSWSMGHVDTILYVVFIPTPPFVPLDLESTIKLDLTLEKRNLNSCVEIVTT